MKLKLWFRHTWKYLHWSAAQYVLTNDFTQYSRRLYDVLQQLYRVCPICGKHFKHALKMTKGWQPELGMYVIHCLANQRAGASAAPDFLHVVHTYRQLNYMTPLAAPSNQMGCQCGH